MGAGVGKRPHSDLVLRPSRTLASYPRKTRDERVLDVPIVGEEDGSAEQPFRAQAHPGAVNFA